MDDNTTRTRHRIDVEYALSDSEDEIQVFMKTTDGSKMTGQMIMDAVVDLLQHMRTGSFDESEGPVRVH